MQRILPTHYFHCVFTLPSQLHGLALANRELIYDLLLVCSAEALQELGRDPKWLGAQFGITSVLHTWNRELQFHPHAHCIVTGGGLSLDGERWVATRPDFLLPVRVLGELFRGKFLARLAHAYRDGLLKLEGPAAPLADPSRFARVRDKLYRTRWHVYVKPPFGGPEQVFNPEAIGAMALEGRRALEGAVPKETPTSERASTPEMWAIPTAQSTLDREVSFSTEAHRQLERIPVWEVRLLTEVRPP